MYGTLADANQYHADRGNTAWAGTDTAKTAALIRASDYIDGRYRYQTAGGCWRSMFRGTKTDGRGQEREWPRTGATDSDGNAIPDNEVPVEVERATYEAALRELTEPGSLSPDYVAAGQVTRETVGPITVQYASGQSDGAMPPNRPVVTVVDDILAGLICDRPKFGIGVRVV